MKYNFYVQMDGQVYGPYSAIEINRLGLLDDTLVTEDSMNGTWLPACKFDFDDMVMKELNGSSAQPTQVHEQQRRPIANNSYQRQAANTQSQYQESVVDPSALRKWNWGSFTFGWLWGVCNGVYWPLVNILLCFVPYVGSVIALGVNISLGVKGTEWAWNSQCNSTNFQTFINTQRKWSNVGKWVFFISIGLAFLGGIAIGMAM